MIQTILSALDTKVLLSVTSPDSERFVNGCLNAGVYLRQVRRVDALTLTCRMRAAEFRRLPGIVRGKHCRVRILKKFGFVQRALPYIRRPFFLLGFIGALVFLYAASAYVWNVTIAHNGARDSEILRKLAEFGLRPGVAISEIDEGQIKEQVISALPNLSWVGIFLRGSTAEIDYRLRVPTPEIIPLDEPCSIYAAKDGVLTKLYVYQGKTVASVGETVMRGDLLVSAVVPIGEEGNFVLSHALADTEARTWYDIESTVPATVQKKVYTGNVLTKKYLVFQNQRINLSPDYGKIYEEYDIIIEKQQVVSVLPLTVVTEKYVEYTTEEVPADLDAEQKRLEAALTETLSASLVKGGILSSRFEPTVADGALTVRMLCECYEDIAEIRPYSPADEAPPQQPANP